MKLKSKEVFPYLFEGFIFEIGKEGFWARLIDLTNYEEPDLEAEFLLAHIKPEDLPKITEGATFNFLIEQICKDGELIGTSRIIFHPLTVWTKEEVQEAQQAGQDLFDSIKWE